MAKNLKLKTIDAVEDVQRYIDRATWEIRENANLDYSFSSVFMRLAGESVSRYVLLKVYPKAVSEAHKDRWRSELEERIKILNEIKEA